MFKYFGGQLTDCSGTQFKPKTMISPPFTGFLFPPEFV